MARAAAFSPDVGASMGQTLAAQMEGFLRSNPWPLGVHWSSGQEIVVRVLAWLFAVSVLGEETFSRLDLAAAIHECALHVERHRVYAEKAVHNNHLLAEALMGLVAAETLPAASQAQRWRSQAMAILEEQAERQFYPDGGYIQQSHTYQRIAMQYLLAGAHILRAADQPVPPSWLRALERSVDFLVAVQNPADGRLPNYGENDGGIPLLLSTCDFADFRPSLQAANVLTRGERLYEEGPWDEEAAWLLGPQSLEAPLHPPKRRSTGFGFSGHHVLRSNEAEGTFVSLRCGTVRDRFSQNDMLHLDVWWRGQNVRVDGGSFQYNAAERWHDYFAETGSHNTVTIDGQNQMLHYRRFKNLYWTRARLMSTAGGEGWQSVEGEHYGYERQPGRCVHRRSVLLAGADLILVVDSVRGEGERSLRLHWLAGDYPFSHSEQAGTLRLSTPGGPFTIGVFDELARPFTCSVAFGQDEPPRGWLSRYYGEKVPVPSLVAECRRSLPCTYVSVLAGGLPIVSESGGRWTVETDVGVLSFALEDGALITPTFAAKNA